MPGVGGGGVRVRAVVRRGKIFCEVFPKTASIPSPQAPPEWYINLTDIWYINGHFCFFFGLFFSIKRKLFKKKKILCGIHASCFTSSAIKISQMKFLRFLDVMIIKKNNGHQHEKNTFFIIIISNEICQAMQKYFLLIGLQRMQVKHLWGHYIKFFFLLRKNDPEHEKTPISDLVFSAQKKVFRCFDISSKNKPAKIFTCMLLRCFSIFRILYLLYSKYYNNAKNDKSNKYVRKIWKVIETRLIKKKKRKKSRRWFGRLIYFPKRLFLKRKKSFSVIINWR